jgi:hypothetical protein
MVETTTQQYDNLVLLPIDRQMNYSGYREYAHIHAGGLPTRQDFEKAGINAGDKDVNFPVSRPDRQEDWI